MSKVLEKFDANKAMDNIKKRIKSTFVSLIPDAQWKELVKKEVDDFFKVKDRGWRNGKAPRASDFTLLVQKTITEEAEKRLTKYIESIVFDTTWDTHGKPILSAEVERMIVDNSGQILTNLVGGMINNAMQNVQHNLQMNNQNGY